MTLDQFIDESIRRSAACGYHPKAFMGMREDARRRGKGVASVIALLVESSEPKSGFLRLVQLALTDWSLEAAVMKFPKQFSNRTRAYAEERLKGTFDA